MKFHIERGKVFEDWTKIEVASISDLKQLPTQGGLYGVFDDKGNLLYIGKSTKIRYRWWSAHIIYEPNKSKMLVWEFDEKDAVEFFQEKYIDSEYPFRLRCRRKQLPWEKLVEPHKMMEHVLEKDCHIRYCLMDKIKALVAEAEIIRDYSPKYNIKTC